MMSYINKRIGDMLASGFMYKLIVRPAIKNGFLKTGTGFLCVQHQSPYLQSLIYWNIYESSEVKLIRRFLKHNLPVIEFGASLGKTSSTICATVNKNVPVIAVEANPRLFYNLNETKSRNGLSNLTLICAAVDYSGAANIHFILDESNLGSRKGVSKEAVSVPAIQLCDIVIKNNLEQFSLVCDIEGAELEMFLHETDPRVINGCRQIIIELHPAAYQGRNYQRSEISDIIQEKFQMKTILTDGKTWVYEKDV